MCQFLNLRHSSIDSVDFKFLVSLRYVDISFSRITEISFDQCALLEKVLADPTQRVSKGDTVVLELIYGTLEYLKQ